MQENRKQSDSIELSPCDLSVIILTFNEELHIRRCIDSIREVAKSIVVVDSGSTDKTREIAQECGARVLTHHFWNYSAQFNWALDYGGIDSEWVMRLDADEFITPELGSALRCRLNSPPDTIDGFTINLRRFFLGKWLRHGALYPIRLVRIWRYGKGRCETRWMDEHVVVDGSIEHIDADFADDNLNNITWWTEKHNRYASREAADILLSRHEVKSKGQTSRAAGQAAAKRWVKTHIYGKMPLGLRSVCYLLYRYFVRLGFLDGWPGFVFHFLQAGWYRLLVDVKVYEVEKAVRSRNISLHEAAVEILGVDLAQCKCHSGAMEVNPIPKGGP